MAILCKSCNGKRIETRDDKDNVLFVNPTLGKTMYGKLYICKDCAHQWTDKDSE